MLLLGLLAALGLTGMTIWSFSTIIQPMAMLAGLLSAVFLFLFFKKIDFVKGEGLNVLISVVLSGGLGYLIYWIMKGIIVALGAIVGLIVIGLIVSGLGIVLFKKMIGKLGDLIK